MTNNDKIIGAIRTLVPAAVAWILAQLTTAIPAVGEAITHVEVEIGVAVVEPLELVLTAVILVAYYLAVRKVAERWPWVEGFLGSTKSPVGFVTKGN
ncbi:hypothetical protein [Microbacterium sp. ZXX196]|uniref:hypothetical protein n=1 Tax=Microbacterium sp. ZXX196 TaxID=2609291 RepID=UPI0012B84B37|nr:hypothetical protein [Microbacterium sp. ZXX196]MTE24817.1 hypothetical protein [Microbacterium sp. ZXX196]